MGDIATATRIRAVAFTPGLWAVRNELSQPVTTRQRVCWLRVASVALVPTLIVSAINCCLTARRDASLGQLRVSANQQVVATIRDPNTSAALNNPSIIIALAFALPLLLAYLGVAFTTAWGIGRLTQSPALTFVTLVLCVLGPPIPIAWRYITLKARRQPLRLRQRNDITIEGFSRLPVTQSGTAFAQLVAWLPAERPLHGVAFEGLLPAYQSVATLQQRTMGKALIGNAWKVRGRTLRPALYELRVF